MRTQSWEGWEVRWIWEKEGRKNEHDQNALYEILKKLINLSRWVIRRYEHIDFVNKKA